MTLKSINRETANDLAMGAAFLGAGGGGDPYIGLLMARTAIDRFGPVDVVSLDAVEDDAAIYSAAMIGAPSVFTEKIPSGDDIVASVEALARHLDRAPDCIVPIEIGGCNSMIPIAAAAALGVPLIDADGMGRAFPELQMVTFNVAGVSCSPVSLVDEHGRRVLIETTAAKEAEDLARAICIQMGLAAQFSCYPMTGSDLKASAVEGTLTLAHQVGRAITQPGQTTPRDSLVATLRGSRYYDKAYVLATGKVSDIDRRTSGGFTVGTCKIEDTSGEVLEIEFQNENLSARTGDIIHAVVPDLITIIDAETAEPITNENLRFGQRVTVVATSCAPIMRSPAALQTFGPAAFGMDMPYTPVERLMGA